MPKTVQLTKPTINQVTINPQAAGGGNMVVTYTLADDTGTTSQTDSMYFWRNMPDPGLNADGSPAPIPANWVQLPPAAKTGLGDLLTYVNGRINALLTDTVPTGTKVTAAKKTAAK